MKSFRRIIGRRINQGIDRVTHPPQDPPPPVVGPSRVEERVQDEWNRGSPKIEKEVPVGALVRVFTWLFKLIGKLVGVLILVLLSTPVFSCVDNTPLIEDIQIAVLCKPITIQPGTARCKLQITNENQCLGLLFPARLGLTTTYYQSDPGGIVSGESLNPFATKLSPLKTRRFKFTLPLDSLSESVEVLVHATGTQESTGASFEIFRSERFYAP